MTSRINKNVCVYVGMYEGLTTEILEWLRQHSGRWVSGVLAPHFNRDTVEFASRKGDESNPGIKTLMPFLRNITGRERFGEFSRSHSALRCLLLASQDNVNKFIAIRRRSCDLAD